MQRKPQETYWNLVKDNHAFTNLTFGEVPDYKLKRVMPGEIAHSLPTLRVMAWLFSYHAAHAWQLQDLLNYDASNASRIISQIYQTGMLERSVSKLATHPYIYKISKQNRFNIWLDYLPYRAWLGVTAGQERYRPSFSIRHNLAAGDVALAAGKIERIKAVLGETLATSKLMFGVSATNRGDIVFVTEDGLKIVIEITSSGGQKEFTNKIITWGKVMLEVDDPFKVIFLDVAPSNKVKNNLWAISSAIKNVNRSDFGTFVTNGELEMIKSRIGMNSFGRWLDNGVPTDDFHNLIAYKALDGKRQMEEFSAFDTAYEPSPAARKILDNYSYLYAIPYDLRMRNKKNGVSSSRFKATSNPFGDKATSLADAKEIEQKKDEEVDLSKRIDELFKNASNGLALGFPELDD